jgi:hypothetical protein
LPSVRSALRSVLRSGASAGARPPGGRPSCELNAMSPTHSRVIGATRGAVPCAWALAGSSAQARASRRAAAAKCGVGEAARAVTAVPPRRLFASDPKILSRRGSLASAGDARETEARRRVGAQTRLRGASGRSLYLPRGTSAQPSEHDRPDRPELSGPGASLLWRPESLGLRNRPSRAGPPMPGVCRATMA